MSLSPGTRLGPYEIISPLGAGGMGEVYRARDQRLGREVAVKVLSAHLVGDPAALGRFEREAQAVAALSHTNILAIHDFGSSEGVTYTVTELLAGETLRTRLSFSPLPTRKTVEYAIQVVRGLAAAHERGIVHRDVKPENIFLTRDGVVKILDFGLAKTTGLTPEANALAETQLGADTAPGTVLGTVGYMSPEQVRGLVVDQRTDIFSFGCVCYEMLAGRRAFRGNSHVETMHAILKEDPPDLQTVQAGLPASLDRLVRRCLEKDPNDRFHSAHDLALALETLSGSSGTSSEAVAAAPPGRSRHRAGLAALIGVAMLAAAGGFAAAWFLHAASAVVPEFKRLSFRRTSITYAHFVPGSDTVLYSGAPDDGVTPQIFTMHVSNPNSTALPFSNADVVSISSTGELAIVSDRKRIRAYASVGTLARVPLAGGAPRAVLDNVQDADWMPDGANLVVADYVNGQYRIEFPIGHVVYSTPGWVSHPRVSADGTRVAFLDHPIMGDDRGKVMVVDAAGHATAVSTSYESTQGLAWAPSGREVWFTATAAAGQGERVLCATTLDGRVRTVFRAPGSLLLNDIAPDGHLLLTLLDLRPGILGVAPGDTTERELSALDFSLGMGLSADGKTVLIAEEGSGSGPGYDVYIRPTDGSPAVRLGSGQAQAISPDGRWVIAARLDPAPAQLVLMPTGVGASRTLTNDNITHLSSWFLPDGKHFVFIGSEPGKRVRTYLQALAGGPPRPVTPDGVVASLVSADGTKVGAAGAENRFDLFPIAGGPAVAVQHDPADTVVAVTTTGDLLVSRSTPDGGFDIARVNPTTSVRAILHHIAPHPGSGRPGSQYLRVTPDGRGYVYNHASSPSTLYVVTGMK